MAIHGADVVEPEFFEECPRDDHTLDVFLCALGKFPYGGDRAQDLLAALPHRGIEASREQFGQIVR